MANEAIGQLQERIAALEAEVTALAAEKRRLQQGATDRLTEIADAMPVMISYVDADQRFRFVNKTYEQWFGLPVDRIVGRRLSELMSPETFAVRAPFVRRALAGERVSYEASFPRADGMRQTRIEHIPRRSGDQVIGFYSLIYDMTEQWQALQVATESEQRFRRIADSAPIPMWLTAPDRTREFVNETYVHFSGVPYDEALVFDWRTILHPDDVERVLQESIAGERSRQRFVLEARYRRGDGEWRWLRSISQPRFDDAGMPEGFIGVAIDVTDSRRAADAARDAAAVLSERVDRRTRERDRLWTLSGDPIAILDRSGVCVAASPAWTNVLGWPVDALAGRTTEWLLHPDDAAVGAAFRARIAAGETVRDLAMRLRTADDGYRWIEWSAFPDQDFVYCIARDVTPAREQADALRQVEETLRQSQKMEALGQLTGGVAHDFNNLLTPILGTLDLLALRMEDDPRLGRLIGGALQSAERAKTLVSRLLAFARRQPLERKPLPLGALVEAMRDLLRTTVGPTIALTLDVAPDLPPAMVDANQVEMAILNLAVNARDAMPDGGRLTITVDALETPGTTGAAVGDLAPGRYVRVEVADTGTGMDEETLRRATEPFFSTKAQGAGTGLGLSMVHGLAGQLGGTLTIDSRVGEGTRIALILPVGADVAPVATPAEEESAPGKSTILLVDDDPLVRANTLAMLTAMQHDVIDCASGAEALALLDDGLAPDVLVTDQVMPAMTGTQLIEAVRHRRPDLPALLISGYPQGLDQAKIPATRLAKPFRSAELARALSSLTA